MHLTTAQRMYQAIESDDSDAVRQVLREDQEQLTAFPGVAPTWLHYAAGEGKLEIIDVFLAAGLDVNFCKPPMNLTPLNKALTSGQFAASKHLLARGADPNAERILIAAINAKKNSFELVKLLVEHGVDVNKCWKFGDDGPLVNALSWATSNKREDIAKFLRANGAVMPTAEAAESATKDTRSKPSDPRDEVTAYFNNHIGPVSPRALTEIVPSDVPINIHVIRPEPRHDFVTLFTTGMSDRPMIVAPEGESYRFAELAIHLPPSWPLSQKAFRDPSYRWPFIWLRKIASYPHQEKTCLGGVATIIANGEPAEPFAPGCPFAAMLLVANYDNLGPIRCPDGRVIHLYTLMPLYPAERKLELSHDLPELFRRFDAFNISKVVDLHRPNVAVE